MAKAKYYNDIFEKYKNAIKKTWQHISEILNKQKQNKNFVKELVINDVSVTDKQEIANKFNEFFVNVGPNLAHKINTENKRPYSSYLNKVISSKFYFTPIQQQDLSKIIKSLRSKSSSGHDSI